MYNGIININKEKGYTSHDVVAKLRGILKQKKIGHTGTLDPEATGVLLVCLGNATKLCDMLTDKSKEYEATMLLGVTTDTEDTTGKVLNNQYVTIDEESLRKVIESFVGEYQQVPPMYSALKLNGKKLYELAREGISVERKPRKVFIEDINIVSVELPYVKFVVKCSKGTYIRALCRDIGDKCGCGACMDNLVRTRVSDFELEKSMTLAQIQHLAEQGNLEDYILPADSCFMAYDSVIATGRDVKLIKNGNAFFAPEKNTELVRVYLEEEQTKNFAGVYCYDRDNNLYRPKKMFLSQENI